MSNTPSAAFSDTKAHYDLLDGLRGVAALMCCGIKDVIESVRIIQSGNFCIADAITSKLGTVNDGAGSRGNTQPSPIGTEFTGYMATANRIDCSYNSLFCTLLYHIYA